MGSEDIPNPETASQAEYPDWISSRHSAGRTSYPGKPANWASHGPFRYLWKLNPGEEIILYDGYLIYTYVVREQLLVYPEQSSVLNDTSQPQLTLITCTTWDEETLSYLRRLVVFADLEKVEARLAYMD